MADRSAAEWAEAVGDAERRGELLTAFDLAERALDEHPDDLWLKHRAVLALARAGSTDEAARRFREYGLEAVEDEDVAALRARIVKDIALAADGAERSEAAARSAALYAAIHERTGGWYPAVNAATLSLIAGEPGRAQRFARAALEALAERGDGSYYAAATEAEAELVLGRPDAAAEAVARAVALNEGDYGALSTTRRQLRLVCEATAADAAVLAPLAGPSVAHFCGHRVGADGAEARFPADAEAQVATAIAAELDREPVGYGYGALAAGADILWAEALLAHGAELHVVLPVSLEEFVRASVAPAGPAWVERFHRCLDEATTIQYATDDARGTDDVLFRYGSELAMGLALLRARFLDAQTRQLAVWDRGGAHGAAGTAIDIATWRRGRRVTVAIDPAGRRWEVEGDTPAPVVREVAGGARDGAMFSEREVAGGARDGAMFSEREVAGGARDGAMFSEREVTGGARDEAMVSEPRSERVVRAVLFADMRGFSKLTDEQYVRFDETVMAAFARVVEGADGVASVNTWGDALAVVLDDVLAAANCALRLQEEMASLDLASADLPEHLALRLGAHLGPVLPSFDPVRGVPTFTGSHVSRTARIEPVTPPGAIYVTSAFAAALLLGGRDELACDYVGHMPAAKDWGRLRMYRLRRR